MTSEKDATSAVDRSLSATANSRNEANVELNTSHLATSITNIIGAFCSLFISVGFMNAWGVWQEYYHKHQLKDRSEFDIAWIGSFATFVLMFGGAAAGILVDKVGPTPLLATACTTLVLGIFMTSLCEEYWQYFLAQGLLTGLSMSFLTIPCVSTLALHFTKHRGLATGLTIAGSSLGGVIWPIVDDQLLNHRGMSFGWTMRINGFIMIPLAIITVLFVRQPKAISETPTAKADVETTTAAQDTTTISPDHPPQKPKPDLSILKKPVFIFFVAGTSIFNLGMFSPFFFITAYAVSLGYSASYAFYAVSTMNASSLFGRILIGILADKLGAFNCTTVAAALGAMICYCWTSATGEAGVMLWTCAYGFSSGAILSLQMQCATAISTKQTFGTVLGVGFGLCSLTGLVGTPISGELAPHGFLAVSMFTASTLLLGSFFLLCARLNLSRRLMDKV